MEEASELIMSVSLGDRNAVNKLLPLVYDELRAIAARRLQQERADHTLQATALVNEAYLRMADQTKVNWQGKAHFCAVAATMMRRILVDHARQKDAAKRQGASKQVAFESAYLPDLTPEPVDIVIVDDLLQQLATLNERHARVFELRCFGGMDVKQTASVMEVSEATVKNYWRYARAWLASQLNSDSTNPGQSPTP